MTCSADDTPINRLRHIAADCASADPADRDAKWFYEAFRRYETGARDGLTLDQALGLTPAAGETPWWESEARSRRNAVIRELRERFFANLKITSAARAIAELARRYQSSTWRHHQGNPQGDLPAEEKRRLLHDALATGLPFPGQRQLRKILGPESSAFDS